ncbi:MAG: hypothetical protein AAF734_07970, partial [Bacteroidota bacterium]
MVLPEFLNSVANIRFIGKWLVKFITFLSQRSLRLVMPILDRFEETLDLSGQAENFKSASDSFLPAFKQVNRSINTYRTNISIMLGFVYSVHCGFFFL